MKTRSFGSATDNLTVTFYEWQPDGIAQGVVVIAHGLGDHARRFGRFAEALNQAGYAVYAHDHRGHGASMIEGRGEGDLGSGGWLGLVDDLVQMIDLAHRENDDLPLVLFGHSMGSFAAQHVAQDHSDKLAALILSGSTAYDKLVEAVFSHLAEGGEAGFGFFNAAFEPARTAFDWLSRDDAEVDKYVADPFCGFEFTEESNVSAASESARLADPEMIGRIRPDLPVLFMAGDQDPLNGNLLYLKVLEERWRAAGIRNLDTQYYAGGRHEMLNEINRDEVTRGLIDWIAANLRSD